MSEAEIKLQLEIGKLILKIEKLTQRIDVLEQEVLELKKDKDNLTYRVTYLEPSDPYGDGW